MFRRLLSTIFRVTAFVSILTLLPRMATAPADSKSPADQTVIGMQLTYRVRYRSEGYTELGNALGGVSESRAPTRHSLLASLEAAEILNEMVTTALSAVGSPEAQDALCEAVRAKKDDVRALSSLVPVLGSFGLPTQRVIALLTNLSHSPSPDVRSMAVLAFGAAAKNLAPKSPHRADLIVKDLVGRLSSSKSTDDRLTLLLALSNTGSDTARSIIVSQQADPSPTVRRTVCTALSSFQHPDSVRALTKMLKSDQDPNVRASAVQALAAQNREPSVKEALLQAAQRDIADNVRVAAMFSLTDLVHSDGKVHDVIASLTQGDGSEVVRKQAAILLQGANAGK